MSLLDDTFKQLLDRLRNPEALNPAKSDPIFYLAYPPEMMLELKRCLPRWIAKLRETGFEVRRVSLADLLWKTIDDSGRWKDWTEFEGQAEPEEVNDSVRDVVGGANGLAGLVADIVEGTSEGTVLLLTEAELLHPYFRTRTIESRLHEKVRAPIVIFYPGRRSGQYGLHLLGFYPVDGNYRSTLLGGV